MFCNSIFIEGLKQRFSRESCLVLILICDVMRLLYKYERVIICSRPINFSSPPAFGIILYAAVSHALLSEGILVALATVTKRNLKELDRLNY